MATSHKYVCTDNAWTYGAELELADWPRHAALLPGMAIDDGARTNVNSNGVAIDGPGKLYHLGGEILTAPSVDPSGPAEQFAWIMQRWPETALNYRMGLNVHVRVPGLIDDLKKLKKLQAFIHVVMPDLLPVIDPIPFPTAQAYSHPTALAGARRNYNTRKKDHYTLLKTWRLELQNSASTPREFLDAEAIHLKTGKVHWALALRACVNLRQLLQTDTVEFRHFPMPATAEELLSTTRWCQMFLEAAFDGGAVSSSELLEDFGFVGCAWPKFMLYDPWLDEGFHYTGRHYHSNVSVPARIDEWLTHVGKESVFWKDGTQ